MNFKNLTVSKKGGKHAVRPILTKVPRESNITNRLEPASVKIIHQSTAFPSPFTQVAGERNFLVPSLLHFMDDDRKKRLMKQRSDRKGNILQGSRENYSHKTENVKTIN